MRGRQSPHDPMQETIPPTQKPIGFATPIILNPQVICKLYFVKRGSRIGLCFAYIFMRCRCKTCTAFCLSWAENPTKSGASGGSRWEIPLKYVSR